MQVTLPPEKIENALFYCHTAIQQHTVSIQFLAQLIGTLISIFPACSLGQMHYGHLERIKVEALRKSHGSFDGFCTLNDFCIEDLQWWINSVPTTAAPINRGNPDYVIFTDSSDYAFGAYFQDLDLFTQGFFTPQEKDNIIAVKEMLAVFYAFKAFLPYIDKSHVLIRSDSVASIAYLQDFGGMKNLLMDDIARQIWQLAIDNGIWITASFISGDSNVQADLASRILSDKLDWTLPMETFHLLTKKLFLPSVDLMASRLNARLDRYFSWIPDPYCENVDCFSISWADEIPYLFPPFSLLSRCISKLSRDNCQMALIIFPLWLVQLWITTLLHMLMSEIYLLPENPPLYLPWQTIPMQHPLQSNLLLSTAVITANQSKHWNFLKRFPVSLETGSDLVQRKLTRERIKNGYSLRVQGHLIPICLL